MYPRISDLFQDLFGVTLPFPIYSFGAMVAAAVLVAAWLSGKELDRKYRLGLLPGVMMPERGNAQEAKGKGKRKKKAARPRMVEQPPSVIMGTVTLIAMVAGFLGARLFHILENFGAFIQDPWDMLWANGGFTFYGGLILAGVSIAWYVRKKGMRVPVVADALAPGLMIAYGIGRIGCHLAGDKDWGITADLAAKPDWLPMWLWAETYPQNLAGIDLSNAPVYPTPIYEFVMAALLFAVLWGVRKHPFLAGWLFSCYLFLNGLERFIIEKIRVNNEFQLFGVVFTQAEMIALALMLAGAIGMWRTWKRVDRGAADVSAPTTQPAPAS